MEAGVSGIRMICGDDGSGYSSGSGWILVVVVVLNVGDDGSIFVDGFSLRYVSSCVAVVVVIGSGSYHKML